MIKVCKLLANHWQKIILGLCAIGIIGGPLVYRLGSLAPQLSPGEQVTTTTSYSIGSILSNLTNAPHKLLEWPTQFAPPAHAATVARLPSVVFACLALVLLAYILRRWYGRRSMLFGLALFLCSAWFLHVARFAGFEIDYVLGIIILLAMHIIVHDYEDNPLIIFAWLFVNLGLLLIPGFIWFILLSLIWQFRALVNAWQELSQTWARLLWLVAAVLGLMVPVVSIIWTPRLLWPWLGLPNHFISWQVLLSQLHDTVLALIYRGPHTPELWLGNLPLLDIFVLGMVIIGTIFYVRRWRATRTQLLYGYLLLGIILSGLGVVQLSVLLPIVYIIVAGGIAYILYFWLRIFPRNALARYTGIMIVAAVLSLSCIYNLTEYFVAWPHNPETAATYHSLQH